MQQHDLTARERMFAEPIANLLGRAAGEILGIVVPQHYRVSRSPRVGQLGWGQLSEGRPQQPRRPAHQFYEQTVCPNGLRSEPPSRHLLRRGMRVSMVADRVSSGCNLGDQPRMRRRMFAEQEERALDLVRAKHIQDTKRVVRVRSVIESKANLAAVSRSRHHKRPPWQNGGHAQPRPLARSSAQ